MSLIDKMRPGSGLRVIITDGAAGIGRTIAEAFLEADARVHICDVSRDTLDAFTESHPEAGATLADVANEAVPGQAISVCGKFETL
jgi:short-subunit dehydrogenase involved in D-alanine esterification of teichoic acids